MTPSGALRWLLLVTLAACSPPPPRDVTTYACLALAGAPVVASEARGLVLASRADTDPLAPASSQRVAFCVRVRGGAQPAPRVELDLVASSESLFSEPLEIHCSGHARREPSPDVQGGERLTIDEPACTRWADSPGQCPYVVDAITIDVARDGSVRVTPFDATYRDGGTCEGYSTRAIRVGAQRLLPTAPPS